MESLKNADLILFLSFILSFQIEIMSSKDTKITALQRVTASWQFMAVFCFTQLNRQ